jgi:hypothetical protein
MPEQAAFAIHPLILFQANLIFTFAAFSCQPPAHVTG